MFPICYLQQFLLQQKVNIFVLIGGQVQMMKKAMIIVTIFAGLLVVGCGSDDSKEFEASFDGSIDHVHGIGYVGNDNGLYLATHTGLKMYRDGEWLETTKNLNDYMGFNAVDKGFYTSGHPGEDSDLPNPIGIQRSFDGGKTLESLSARRSTVCDLYNKRQSIFKPYWL